MNAEQKVPSPSPSPSPSPPLTMICVSAKQEQHSRSWIPATDNHTSPARTSFSAIEARPLQSCPLPSTKPLENGVEVEEKKPEKEHKRRSKNWTRIETMKLIGLRSELEPRFLRTNRKSELWNEIAEALRSEGICRDAQQCRDKWEKLTAGYKEVRDGVRVKEDYPFFQDLDPLLSGKLYRRESQRIELPREIGEDNNTFIRSDGEDTEDADAGVDDFPARKRRKSGNNEENDTFDSLKDLLESVIARQHRFFMDLLESMERREKMREKIRQEREEKWREEDRAQRLVFQNTIILLTKKLSSCACYPTPSKAPPPELAVTAEASGGGIKKRSKNWKRAEVLLLIKLRAEMEERFVKSTRRGVLWEEVAELLCAEGVTVKRDGKQCREKWDKLMAVFKEVSDGKRDPADSPYYTELLAVTRGSPSSVDAPATTHIV